MLVKEVSARIVLDSRKEETIEISVNACRTSAPSGKSKGKYEMPDYIGSVRKDAEFINTKIRELVASEKFPRIFYFGDLDRVEKVLKGKVGANTLFAFEASVLKALAVENKKQLWQIINHKLNKHTLKDAKFPRILSNTIGGGAHSGNKIKPDFQEFLVVCDKGPFVGHKINLQCYREAEFFLREASANKLKINDENAWQTDLDNEEVLGILEKIKKIIFQSSVTNIFTGLDCASSQFYDSKKKKYLYKNRKAERSSDEQIDYILGLIKKYNLFYVEDPLDEEDFGGFAKLLLGVQEAKSKCLIVGDDLTTTNFKRVEKAIQMKSINGLIIKPNQIGSLLEVRRVFELCKKNNIKTIVSHRSGETNESFIADLAFALGADFIKTPVVGEEREIKVKRLIHIESSLK